MADIFARRDEALAAPETGSNHGRLWTTEGRVRLNDLFHQGESLTSICKILGRSGASILAKLMDAMLIEESAAGHYRCRVERNNTTPTTEKENAVNAKTIETVVMIQGQNAGDKSDDQIFKLIADLETRVRTLEQIESKPKKLTTKIAEIKDDIKKLVEYVDGR